MWLAQEPSPAQAAAEGWWALWCVSDLYIDLVILCIAACYGSALNDYYELYVRPRA